MKRHHRLLAAVCLMLAAAGQASTQDRPVVFLHGLF
jgi:hypothetical protein